MPYTAMQIRLLKVSLQSKDPFEFKITYYPEWPNDVFDEQQLQEILPLLENNFQVRKIFLFGLDKDTAGKFVAAIANLLKNSQCRLNTIQINKSGLEDREVFTLACGLRHCSTLLSLDLSENDITEWGSKLLTAAISAKNTVKALNLKDNKIVPSAQLLFDSKQEFPELDVIPQSIGAAAVSAVSIVASAAVDLATAVCSSPRALASAAQYYGSAAISAVQEGTTIQKILETERNLAEIEAQNDRIAELGKIKEPMLQESEIAGQWVGLVFSPVAAGAAAPPANVDLPRLPIAAADIAIAAANVPAADRPASPAGSEIEGFDQMQAGYDVGPDDANSDADEDEHAGKDDADNVQGPAGEVVANSESEESQAEFKDSKPSMVRP